MDVSTISINNCPCKSHYQSNQIIWKQEWMDLLILLLPYHNIFKFFSFVSLKKRYLSSSEILWNLGSSYSRTISIIPQKWDISNNFFAQFRFFISMFATFVHWSKKELQLHDCKLLGEWPTHICIPMKLRLLQLLVLDRWK